MCTSYVFLNFFFIIFSRLIFVSCFQFALQWLNALWPGNNQVCEWSHAEVKAKMPAPLCLNTCLGSPAALKVPLQLQRKPGKQSSK